MAVASVHAQLYLYTNETSKFSNWMEFDSNRGSQCFGCLVSAEAHGYNGCQVLLREALSRCGPSARTAAGQHQGGREVCSQSERRQHLD